MSDPKGNRMVVPGVVVRVVKPAHVFEGVNIPTDRYYATVIARFGSVHPGDWWTVRDVDTGALRPVLSEWCKVKRSKTRAERERPKPARRAGPVRRKAVGV